MIMWWLTGLSIAFGAGLVFVLFLHFSLQKKFFEFTHLTDTVKKDLNAVTNGTVGIGKRLNILERNLKDTERTLKDTNERQDILELREPADKQYGQAQRMIESGASIEEVVATCQISRNEAKLMQIFKSPQAKDIAD